MNCGEQVWHECVKQRSNSARPHEHSPTREAALHLWLFPYLWVHVSWTCRVSRSTRLQFLVRGLGTLRLRSAELPKPHPMTPKCFRCYGRVCEGPVKIWTTARYTDESFDVAQRSQHHSRRVVTLGSQSARSFQWRCTYSRHIVTCGSYGRRGLRNLQVVMLSNVGMIVVLTEQRSSAAPSRGIVAAALIYLFTYGHRKGTSDFPNSHLQLGALGAMMWCFVSSVRQGSGGVLEHYYCVARKGPLHVQVAVELLSDVRGMRWCRRDGSFISIA